MNSLITIAREKTLWPSFIIITIIFLIVPHIIFSNSYLVGVILLCLFIGILFTNQEGAVFIIFAYGCILPYGELGVGTGVSRYFLYIYILVVFVHSFIYKRTLHYNFGRIPNVMVGVLLLSIIFYFINEDTLELWNGLFFIFSTYLFFYVCLKDEITLKKAFIIIDVIFYLTFFYVVEENLLKNSPYQAFYSNLSLDFQLRAKGLMGHPLLLSSFISFYNITLIARGIIYRDWNIFNIFLVIPLLILSASKTLILLFFFGWTFYFIISRTYKNITLYLVISLLIYIGLGVFPVISILFDSSIQRIVDSSANHRIGSYSVAIEIFLNNFMGIGTSLISLSKEVNRSIYSLNPDYDKFFLIFDNAYLTAIASFGIFCFLYFYVYFQPIIQILRNKNNDRLRKVAVLFLLNWFLQNFSFDSYYYFTVNGFYFIFIALIIKEYTRTLYLNKDKSYEKKT